MSALTAQVLILSHWNALTSALGTTEKVRDDWWSIVVQHYSEEQRFYHTLAHVGHLLQLYDQWKGKITDSEAVLLAIFFHDIVYNPQQEDNELRSIMLFKRFANDAKIAENTVTKVCNMIEATISHSNEGRQDDLDLSLFLDFDLAILGQDAEVYKQYAENIRKEYIHYADKAYRDGRTKVLKALLNSVSLFSSKELREKYEEQARKNIQGEIAMLNNN